MADGSGWRAVRGVERPFVSCCRVQVTCSRRSAMTQRPLSLHDGTLTIEKNALAGATTASPSTSEQATQASPLQEMATVTSASAPARQAQPSTPRRARILVADDEPRIRLAL